MIKTFQKRGIEFTFATMACFFLAIAATGCAPAAPDESSLDRVPNVPPSSGEAFPGGPER